MPDNRWFVCVLSAFACNHCTHPLRDGQAELPRWMVMVAFGSHGWRKTVLNDLESHNLTLTEAVNVAQNRQLWRLLVASGSTHS